MICPICEMGILEPLVDGNGSRYNICSNCATEVVTPRDSKYNKANRIRINWENDNGNTGC